MHYSSHSHGWEGMYTSSVAHGVGGGPVGHLASAVRTERGADTGSEGEGWKHMVWGGVEGGDESQVGKGGADTHWKGAHGG